MSIIIDLRPIQNQIPKHHRILMAINCIHPDLMKMIIFKNKCVYFLDLNCGGSIHQNT